MPEYIERRLKADDVTSDDVIVALEQRRSKGPGEGTFSLNQLADQLAKERKSGNVGLSG